MISVIILTRNRNYNVLEAAENGRLVIKEKHLICGIVQNGVKCIPYGNVLNAFETFLTDNTLSVEMIPSGVWMPEGRILDFSVIELLQLSTTIPLSASGSSTDFVAPTYSSGGYDVNYVIRLKTDQTLNKDDLSARLQTAVINQGLICNAIAEENNGYKKISLVNFTGDVPNDSFAGLGVSEFYDIGNVINKTRSNVFDDSLRILDLPVVQILDQFTFLNARNIQLIKCHTLPYFGSGVSGENYALCTWQLSRLAQGAQIEVPRSMETANAGSLENDLAQLINLGIAPNIVYID